jgi:capsular polysaccharide biosynthesis protein
MPLSAANNNFFPRTLWRTFLVTLVFVTLASFLFWLDSFRAYQSEIRVLVLAKSSAIEADQVIDNLAELSKTLSFYDRVLQGTDLLDDDFEGYSPDQRRALWNETVRVERSDKSGILIITARQERSEKAKLLSEETSKALLSVASFYYNIKTDVDLRIVEGPIVSTTLAQPWRYVAVSVGSAAGVTAVFFLLLSLVPSLFGKGAGTTPQTFRVGDAVPLIDPKKFVPARPAKLTFESTPEEVQAEEEPVLSEEKPHKEERMLPGMDVAELPFEFEETYPEEPSVVPEGEIFTETIEEPVIPEELPVAQVEEKEEVKAPEPPRGEPTIEEYKRRLNELLAGGR